MKLSDKIKALQLQNDVLRSDLASASRVALAQGKAAEALQARVDRMEREGAGEDVLASVAKLLPDDRHEDVQTWEDVRQILREHEEADAKDREMLRALANAVEDAKIGPENTIAEICDAAVTELAAKSEKAEKYDDLPTGFEAWLDAIKDATLDPDDVARLPEILEAMGVSRQALQYALASENDPRVALEIFRKLER